MKIKFLGSGSAFCLNNFQSNILIEDDNKKLLFDCGGDIRWSMKENNISPLDLDAVYISHSHGDHIGGLEYIAITNYFASRKKQINLYCEENLMDDLWKNSLSGGLKTLQTQEATLDTFFNVCPINNTFKKQFVFGRLSCKLVQTIHIVSDATFVKSFGLMISIVTEDTILKPKKIFITSDTQFAPTQIKDFIKMADVVFHDCETSKFESGVHAHYNDLKMMPKEYKEKMWLYHYNDGILPDAKADGFAGFVQKGQEFEF